ncbi:MAG: glycosyltransferase [Bacteroidales bacterium]|nr:glycosyltransferase [Bacteroidales bacterium]
MCRKEKKNTKKPDVPLPPVSVIICARNESDELLQHLETVLNQDYPVYEVIVVNYCSEDDTEVVLSALKIRYPHLRSTIIKNDTPFLNSKKFAASIGIKAAQYEWLLFTDATCRPASNLWIKSMSRYFTDKKDIVLGHGGYLGGTSLADKWMNYVSCFNTLRYFGFAMCGMPCTGTSKNLAYRKSIYFANNGFANHAHILSGDEDLLVSQAATRKNVAVSLSHNAHTYCSQEPFSGWMQKLCGHFNASSNYKRIYRFLLFFEPFSRLPMWASLVFLMCCSLLWQYILGIYLLRTIIFLIIFGVAAKRFKAKVAAPYALFFDLAMPFFYAYAYLFNKILMNRKWN